MTPASAMTSNVVHLRKPKRFRRAAALAMGRAMMRAGESSDDLQLAKLGKDLVARANAELADALFENEVD